MAKTNSNKIREDSRVIRVILIIVLSVSVLISIYPFIYMFLLSFMETHTMKLSFKQILTAKYTLNNYIRAFSRNNLGRAMANSLIVTCYSVILVCTVSCMAAYAFAKKRFRGRNLLYVLYLATMMIPSQVTLIPTFLILKALKMLNTYSAMVLPCCGAFGTLLVYSFLTTLPDDLLEAADIDGCGEIRKFVSVVLPLIKPVIVSLAIFTFISAWGAMLLPMIVTTKNSMMTLPMALSLLRDPHSLTNYGLIMATSAVAFLPPFILYLFLQKQFVEGIALSGTKM